MPVKESKVQLSLRLIRHQAMRMEGGVGVFLHVFLISAQNVEVSNQLHTLDFFWQSCKKYLSILFYSCDTAKGATEETERRFGG